MLWAIWLSMDDRGSRATPARPPRPLRRWPHLAALVGALALAVGVAACAGGGNTTSGVASLNGAGKPTATTGPGGSSDPRQAAPNFARCMRQHGIDLPDPQITADGIDHEPPTGVARDDPRLRAAGRACGQSRPSTSPVRNAVGLASEHAGDAHARRRARHGRARVLPGAAWRAAAVGLAGTSRPARPGPGVRRRGHVCGEQIRVKQPRDADVTPRRLDQWVTGARGARRPPWRDRPPRDV